MKNQISLYILLIISILTFTNCELEDPNIGILTEEIIAIRSSQPEVLADGISRVTITAELLEKSDPDREITFTTEAGSFPLEGENIQISTIRASGRTAEVVLQSDNENVGLVTVSAAVETYKVTDNIDFVPALPDDIVTEISKNIITANQVDFAQLTTKLFRDTGNPTVGTRINYEVIPLDTATATIVPFSLADMNLESIVNIKSGNGKPGVVQVVISTEGDAEDKTIEVIFEE